jgi:uncharacterized protein (TIGR01732 family)
MSHYGYGYVDPCCPAPMAAPVAHGGYGFGAGFALILVLFILLVIIGAAWAY